MPRPRLLSAILTLVLITVLCANVQAAGINLSWDDCGTYGTLNRDFACNLNTGSETMFGSVVAPPGISQLAGIETLGYISSTSPMPAWWQLQSGGCRQFAGSSSVDFVANSNCVDYWNASGVSGLVYDFAFGSPNISRLRIVAAVPPTDYGPLDSTSEYYMFKFRIGHTKTVGTGACAGCGQEMLITLDQIKLVQPAGVGDFVVTTPLNRSYVTWQMRPVPTQNRTWGAIKSLYR